MVYVISKDGQPLMPTKRSGKVYRLLPKVIILLCLISILSVNITNTNNVIAKETKQTKQVTQKKQSKSINKKEEKSYIEKKYNEVCKKIGADTKIKKILVVTFFMLFVLSVIFSFFLLIRKSVKKNE